MSSEQRKMLVCPVCGNVSSFEAKTCIKCGLDLDPIRTALSQAETATVGEKIHINGATRPENKSWIPSAAEHAEPEAESPTVSDPFEPATNPISEMPVPNPPPKPRGEAPSVRRLLGWVVIGFGLLFLFWGVVSLFDYGEIQPQPLLIGIVLLAGGWYLQKKPSDASTLTQGMMSGADVGKAAKNLFAGSPHIVGTVRGFREREEEDRRYRPDPLMPKRLMIWTFVVDRYDEAGNRLTPVPVEMRGHKFNGVVDEGDMVELDAKWKEGQTLTVTKLRNRTTGGVVEAVMHYGVGEVTGWAVNRGCSILFIIGLIALAIYIISMLNQ